MSSARNKSAPGDGKVAKNAAVNVSLGRSGSKGSCEFCGKSDLQGKTEIEKAGYLFKFMGKFFHYFCVLFSEGIRQSSNLSRGLRGFEMNELQRIMKGFQTYKCHFCGRGKATMKCARCKKKYHFTCGQKHGAIFIYYNNMNTFCSNHGPKQSLKPTIRDGVCLAGCYEKIKPSEKTLVSPCCGRIYHIKCVQSMALSCGKHHFKCPICSDKDEFLKSAMSMGIYLPEQDASWELEEEFYGFEAQGQLYNRCDADKCLCPKGRMHTLNGTYFELIRCEHCGGGASHIKCGRLLKKAPFYLCDRHDDAEALMLQHKIEVRKNPDYSSEDTDGEQDQVEKPKKLTARKSTARRRKEEVVVLLSSDSDEEPSNEAVWEGDVYERKDFFKETKSQRKESMEKTVWEGGKNEVPNLRGSKPSPQLKSSAEDTKKTFMLIHPETKHKVPLKPIITKTEITNRSQSNPTPPAAKILESNLLLGDLPAISMPTKRPYKRRSAANKQTPGRKKAKTKPTLTPFNDSTTCDQPLTHFELVKVTDGQLPAHQMTFVSPPVAGNQALLPSPSSESLQRVLSPGTTVVVNNPLSLLPAGTQVITFERPIEGPLPHAIPTHMAQAHVQPATLTLPQPTLPPVQLIPLPTTPLSPTKLPATVLTRPPISVQRPPSSHVVLSNAGSQFQTPLGGVLPYNAFQPYHNPAQPEPASQIPVIERAFSLQPSVTQDVILVEDDDNVDADGAPIQSHPPPQAVFISGKPEDDVIVLE